MKKRIFKYLILAGFFGVLGFTYTYHIPGFKLWLINQIDLRSQKAPVRILISNIEFTGFPLGLQFDNVRLYPNAHLKKYIDTIHIKKGNLNLSILSLITGHFQISKIQITDPTITIKNIPENKSTDSDPAFPKKAPFKISEILDIPVTTLSISNLNLIHKGSDKFPKLVVNKFSFELENRQNSALISLITPQILIGRMDNKSEFLDIGIGSRVLLNDKQVFLTALKIKQKDSYLLATGEADTNFSTLIKGQLKLKSKLNLTEMQKHISHIIPDSQIPKLQGILQTQMTFKKQDPDSLVATGQISGDSLGVNQFWIGQLKSSLSYDKESVNIAKLNIINNSGKIEADAVKLSLNNDLSFTGNLQLKDIQIQTLLKNLGVGDVNLQAQINSTLPCEGSLKKDTFLNCTGELQINQFRVFNPNLDIAKFETGLVKGSVEVSKNQVKTSGSINIGNSSSGTYNGYVDYKDGFLFNFESPSLNLSEVSIANLGLEGSASLKGNTKGDGHAAIFAMDLQTDNFWIMNYGLGKFKAEASYKKGDLFFKNLSGLFKTTKYIGNLNLDLNNSRIKSNLQIPYIELSDIQKMFERKVALPVQFFGGGTASVNLEGPIDFSMLSYDFKSKFIRGHIAEETFDEIIFDVTSKNGNVSINQAQLKKNNGIMTVKGTANPSGYIKTQWTGSNFALQDFYIFSRSEMGLMGKLDFNLLLTDHILSPTSLLEGKITNNQIAQEPMEDSNFELSFKSSQIAGTANLFGSTIKSEFIIPFDDLHPLKLIFNVNKWNFAPLFSILSNQNSSSEFNTELTGTINLESPKNWFWESSGGIDFSDFKLRRGTKELAATRPISIKFDKGKVKINSFQIRGDNTLLDATSLDTSKYKINSTLNGKLDLSLISFLTPFFSDMKGVMAISSQLKANPKDYTLLGSAFVEDGYIKTQALPHAFESFNLDLLFSTDKILINKFNSLFAGGRINANGQIELKGFKEFPTKLNGTFDNVKLKIPDGFSTEGSGDFSISGNWFPFLLKGNYSIDDGLITKKFDNLLGAGIIKRSSLLPDFLQKKDKSVIELNFNTKFNKGIQVSNDLLDAKIVGNLVINGTPEDPILLGQISTAKASLLSPNKENQFFFREVPFQIVTADLNFNNPQRINPSIYAEATTRVEEKIGNRSEFYDINMLIQGSMENYNISLSSNPPRNEKDIITLLALGVSTENIENQNSSDSLYKQSVEIGSAILSSNPLGKEIKSRTGFNVKLSSGVDEANNSPVPKVTISRQWTPKIGTSASRTFGDFVTQDVKVEYQLNRNVSLVGSWEAKENAPTTENIEQKKTDVLGLDIDYKMEFK